MKIIIGASGGIGGKLFYHYSQEEKVIGTYYKNDPIEHGIWPLDICKPFMVEKFITKTELYLEHICLINCAGINYNSFAHKAAPRLWAEVIDINLIGPFIMINSLLPFMRKQKYGRIINMSSVVAQMGIAGTSAYAASKSGLWGMTKAIAEENKDKGITINNLNLGYMDAGMADGMDVKKGSIQNIINAIDFLVKSDFVTGTSIDINGGLL